MESFDLKSWVTGGTKIRPGIPSKWRIFESNWLSISSQTDSRYRVKLTLNIESNWLSISSQTDSRYRVKLTLNIESNWLSISSQTDSQYRVKLTLNIESNWLSISSQTDSQYRVKLTLNIESNWLSISSKTDSQYRVNLTQLFRSKWLHIFSEAKEWENGTLSVPEQRLVFSALPSAWRWGCYLQGFLGAFQSTWVAAFVLVCLCRSGRKKMMENALSNWFTNALLHYWTN